MHLARLTGLLFSLSLNSCEPSVSAAAQDVETGLASAPLTPYACFESQSCLHLIHLSSGFSAEWDREQSVLYYSFHSAQFTGLHNVSSQLTLFQGKALSFSSWSCLEAIYLTSLIMLPDVLLPSLNLFLLHSLKWGDQKWCQYWRYEATFNAYNFFFPVLFSTPFLKKTPKTPTIIFSEFLNSEILFPSYSGKATAKFRAHHIVCKVRTVPLFRYTDFTCYCIITESLNPTALLLSLPTWIILLNQQTLTLCFIYFTVYCVYLENLSLSQVDSVKVCFHSEFQPNYSSTLLPSLSSGELTVPFVLYRVITRLPTREAQLIFLSDEEYRNYTNLQINIFCIHSLFTPILYFEK